MATASNVVLRNGVNAWRWFVLAGLVVLLDQYTKGLASSELAYARPVEIFSWFNLTLQHNSGAAFSFLSDAGGWQRWFFTVIALVISIGLVVWLTLAERGEWLLGLSLALILGGAIGNLWDRVLLGYVVDFISVHYGGWYFPAFNIADSAITVGAGCMLLDSFLATRRNHPDGSDAGRLNE
ncbi:lipoprotein signal peptidase [Seongchinamella sediminis]|uniref:Lipoprotein signal peptidase n=1 Tax=Seongchinamella sediminis TaxID=2283635 RepID=A0A3L7DVT1_9GAMM|nr:signal peptidase II [Seongchinamella sediminis]RLQ21414.1 lipoprotein signal peptidase [Seongchinamella sediminis]